MNPYVPNQLDTVRDLDKRSLLLVLTTFGHHLLHHLFPSIDHSRHSWHQTDDIRLLFHRLEALYPALWETCQEFGESYPFQTLHTMVIPVVTISIQPIPNRFAELPICCFWTKICVRSEILLTIFVTGGRLPQAAGKRATEIKIKHHALVAVCFRYTEIYKHKYIDRKFGERKLSSWNDHTQRVWNIVSKLPRNWVLRRENCATSFGGFNCFVESFSNP